MPTKGRPVQVSSGIGSIGFFRLYAACAVMIMAVAIAIAMVAR